MDEYSRLCLFIHVINSNNNKSFIIIIIIIIIVIYNNGITFCLHSLNQKTNSEKVLIRLHIK